MAKIYGISSGTTYSAIATICEDGFLEIIENHADSSPLLASAVYFPNDSEPWVGKEARNHTEISSDRVIQYALRDIGSPNAPIWEFDGIKYDPTLIEALILRRMKEYAEEKGHEVENAVIACPAYFTMEEKIAIKQAATIAGFTVLNIVTEPTAAAISYCYPATLTKDRCNILVYDLGGSTFDLTLLECCKNDSGSLSIQIIETNGDHHLGGYDWDERLYDFICELYSNENGVTKDEMDAGLRQRLRSQVEDVKKSISNMPSKSFTIGYAGDVTRLEVTREKFEEQTQDLVEKTMGFVHQLLAEAKLSANDVDAVLLVGGSTRMPMIKAAVEGMFPGKVRVEQPDLAIAKGAALIGSILSPKIFKPSKPITKQPNINSKPMIRTEFDLFELCQLSFDPPEKAQRKVVTIIEKAKKELSSALGFATQQLERENINKRLAFLKAT